MQASSAKKGGRATVKETHVDFSENSTTHGISYAFERDVRSASR